jgi:hypothetical protein
MSARRCIAGSSPGVSRLSRVEPGSAHEGAAARGGRPRFPTRRRRRSPTGRPPQKAVTLPSPWPRLTNGVAGYLALHFVEGLPQGGRRVQTGAPWTGQAPGALSRREPSRASFPGVGRARGPRDSPGGAPTPPVTTETRTAASKPDAGVTQTPPATRAGDGTERRLDRPPPRSCADPTAPRHPPPVASVYDAATSPAIRATILATPGCVIPVARATARRDIPPCTAAMIRAITGSTCCGGLVGGAAQLEQDAGVSAWLSVPPATPSAPDPPRVGG